MAPTTDIDLAFASIEEIARIDQLNPKLNAYITLTTEIDKHKRVCRDQFGEASPNRTSDSALDLAGG
jgi:hypothetical protein